MLGRYESEVSFLHSFSLTSFHHSLEDSFHAWKEEILRKLAELSGIGDFKAKE